jgi:hypothetical protein
LSHADFDIRSDARTNGDGTGYGAKSGSLNLDDKLSEVGWWQLEPPIRASGRFSEDAVTVKQPDRRLWQGIALGIGDPPL